MRGGSPTALARLDNCAGLGKSRALPRGCEAMVDADGYMGPPLTPPQSVFAPRRPSAGRALAESL